MGINGAGKSTLLKLVTGTTNPDKGSVSLGASVKVGYFAQHSMDLLDGESTILQWLEDRFPKAGQAPLRALAGCFGGGVFVQAAFVAFYLAVAYALRIPVQPWDMAVIVPLSFILQMAPVSINGFGVREATFSIYFSRLGLPLESALLVSLVPAVLVMLFSLTGAAVYVGRGRL